MFYPVVVKTECDKLSLKLQINAGMVPQKPLSYPEALLASLRCKIICKK